MEQGRREDVGLVTRQHSHHTGPFQLLSPPPPQTATWTYEAPRLCSPPLPQCPCSLMFWTSWAPWTAAAGRSPAPRAWMTSQMGMCLVQNWTPSWILW